jgi:hypothetical protein
MWLSTKRSSDVGGASNSFARTTFPSTSAKGTVDDQDADWQSTLPLDWTRMSLLKRKPGCSVNDGGSTLEACCQDPSTCRTRRVRPRRDPRPQGISYTSGPSVSSPSSNTEFRLRNRMEGQAIFCLHDLDSAWAQGYFVPRGSKKPWGMLAVQEEVDDCLSCADGGYRRLTLTVYPPTTDLKHRAERGERSQCKIEGVSWTGGDMMSLHHPQHVDMEGQRVLTGTKALPILTKYFRGLVTRLKEDCDVEGDVVHLDLLPNVAIVTGSMLLTLPTTESQRV